MTSDTNDYGELNQDNNGGKIHILLNTEELHRKALEAGFKHSEAGSMYNSLESYQTEHDNHPADGMLGSIDIESLLDETSEYLEEGLDMEEAVRRGYDDADPKRPGLTMSEGEEVDIDELI
jgi:hypothetical protein